MRRLILAAAVCAIVVGLALSGCFTGGEEKPQHLGLEPGGVVTGVDGVSIGAPEGVLDDAIEVVVERAQDPRTEVPFPEYLAGVEVVGDFYAVSATDDFTARLGDYLVLGLPVPEGVSPDDLTLILLVPPDSIIMAASDDNPSLRWIPLRGVYDPESGLLGTLLPSVLKDPLVFALTIAASVTISVDTIGFQVVSIGFDADESPESHRVMTGDALDAAHAAYVGEMGFREPDLRQVVAAIRFAWPPELILENRYEYELRRGTPNGVYEPLSRTAATYYLGAPSEPSPVTARHELFHAIQFGYPALRDNLHLDHRNRLLPIGWQLRRTMEAAATAAELSLDELQRSNRPMASREPHPVTRSLWSSPTVSSYDYAAQDFLVYLGKRIRPADPQLDFMIPWFEQGGLVQDLDMVLQGTELQSLDNSYWEWSKNHAFEKRVILGTDRHGNTVPHGQPCSWSGHGELELVSFSPETWAWGGNAIDFTLRPLTSIVFELTLDTRDHGYVVRSTVDSTVSGIEFKFFEVDEAGEEGCWDCARDSVAHTFEVGAEAVMGYLLVSNTNSEIESGLIRLVATEEEQAVHFPDPNLEAAIREAIGKPTGDIYPMDLEGLTELRAGSRSISDLTGLEYCLNLTFLVLGSNPIVDISPLERLTNLRELYLGDNPLTDVTPLANLTGLTVLAVAHSPISDISPLASLTNLEELALCCNQISDMSSLSGLTKLRTLSIEGNQISDASAVAGLTNLEILWLADNPIGSISYLENLVNLTYLGLGNTQISDISALAHLVNLYYIELQDNHISDILPLVNNSGLGRGDHVILDNNPLSTTSVNTYIPQLRQRGVIVLYGG